MEQPRQIFSGTDSECAGEGTTSSTVGLRPRLSFHHHEIGLRRCHCPVHPMRSFDSMYAFPFRCQIDSLGQQILYFAPSLLSSLFLPRELMGNNPVVEGEQWFWAGKQMFYFVSLSYSLVVFLVRFFVDSGMTAL